MVDVYGVTFAASRFSVEEHVSRQPDISTKDDWFSLWNHDEELSTQKSCTRVIIVALVGECLLRVVTNNFKDGYEVAGVTLPRASKVLV